MFPTSLNKISLKSCWLQMLLLAFNGTKSSVLNCYNFSLSLSIFPVRRQPVTLLQLPLSKWPISSLVPLRKLTNTCPHWLKDGPISQPDVMWPPPPPPAVAALARRLARHACTWYGPLQKGTMTTQNSQTRFKNWVKYPETQSISTHSKLGC